MSLLSQTNVDFPSLLFQQEQPIAVANSCFVRMFSTITVYFAPFQTISLLLQFLGFVLIKGIGMSQILRYPAALQGCSRFPGQVLRLAVPRHHLLSVFFHYNLPIITGLPLWLLPLHGWCVTYQRKKAISSCPRYSQESWWLRNPHRVPWIL